MKNFFALIAACMVAVLAYEAFDFFRFAKTGVGSSQDTQVFEVPSGQPMAKIAARLKAANLISNEFKFRLYAKLTSQDRHVKKGEYQLDRGMSPQAILDMIGSGKSIQYAVTFPEGSNIYDMAEILDQAHFFKPGEFLKLVRDPALVKKVTGTNAPSLEGYLYPETYNLTKYTTAKELVNNMVENFDNVYKSLGTPAVPMARHELVTLASVVEKESGAPSERPLIASVFFNRLKKRMPLQSDPTILYGIIDLTGKPTDNITKADILRPSRYNTYTVKALPYGPISNPGREALAAVVKPPNTEFLYFVSRNNGTSVFTKTYEEHLKAVKQFQLDPTAREGKSWRDLKKNAAATSTH
jgi:UPF0755 protein